MKCYGLDPTGAAGPGLLEADAQSPDFRTLESKNPNSVTAVAAHLLHPDASLIFT